MTIPGRSTRPPHAPSPFRNLRGYTHAVCRTPPPLISPQPIAPHARAAPLGNQATLRIRRVEHIPRSLHHHLPNTSPPHRDSTPKRQQPAQHLRQSVLHRLSSGRALPIVKTNPRPRRGPPNSIPLRSRTVNCTSNESRSPCPTNTPRLHRVPSPGESGAPCANTGNVTVAPSTARRNPYSPHTPRRPRSNRLPAGGATPRHPSFGASGSTSSPTRQRSHPPPGANPRGPRAKSMSKPPTPARERRRKHRIHHEMSTQLASTPSCGSATPGRS